MSTSSSILSEKAMLVHLSISIWTGKRLDKRITREVAEQAGIWQVKPERAGRYVKSLLPQQAESLEAIKQVATSLRTHHYENTLPWAQDGARILPSPNFLRYSTRIRELRGDFDRAVREFLAEYPDLQRNAARILNGNYREQDYPSLDKLRRKFKTSLEVLPFPSSSDFRVDIADEHAMVLRSQIESQVQDAVADAMGDLWKRLYDVVWRMSERLSDPKKIFRDSLIGNIKELVELLPQLNLTNDPKLEEFRRQAQAKLSGFDPQTLRENRAYRGMAAQAAREIVADMQAYMGPIGEVA